MKLLQPLAGLAVAVTLSSCDAGSNDSATGNGSMSGSAGNGGASCIPEDDALECTDDVCESDGTTAHNPKAAGETCSQSNGAVCDGNGNCIGCLKDADCTPPQVCDVLAGGCIDPSSCTDGVKNGDETDVDCGGMTCNPCEDGKTCGIGTDCTSLSCVGNVCAMATCTDGLENGDETDVDCGGMTCNPCDDGKMCGIGTDCKNLSCVDYVCAMPTCTDGVKNGEETDVDCGGMTCNPCESGKTCGIDTDCTSVACIDYVCLLPASCKALKTGLPAAGDGDYLIDADGIGGSDPFTVRCDMTQSGGGWTLAFNSGTSFDPAALGDAAQTGYTSNWTNPAYSTVPITADFMIDASDAAIVADNQELRTVILGVHSASLSMTMHQLFSSGGPYHFDAEDNSNVTNIFSGNTSCVTLAKWGDYKRIVCDTGVLVARDKDDCTATIFMFGFRKSYSVDHANCSGWYQIPNLEDKNWWPDNVRVWVR